MGLFKLFSSDKKCNCPTTVVYPDGVSRKETMPHIEKYEIKKVEIGKDKKKTAVLINYPNATSYNGDKILVYDTEVWLKLLGRPLDPHFIHDQPSPLARFVPTERGWKAAIDYVNMIE